MTLMLSQRKAVEDSHLMIKIQVETLRVKEADLTLKISLTR
jgi:hypothetical protein